MKLSFKSIVISELIFFCMVIMSSWLISQTVYDTQTQTLMGAITGVFIIFFSGFVAGYIARRNQVLHGLIAGLLYVLIPTVIFMSVWLYWGIILKATWTDGSLSDIINFIISGIYATIFSSFVSVCGAKCSELIQKVKIKH